MHQISAFSPKGQLPQIGQDTTNRFVLQQQQKTLNRLRSISKASQLRIPSMSSTFRRSTRNIMTSMMTSLMDNHTLSEQHHPAETLFFFEHDASSHSEDSFHTDTDFHDVAIPLSPPSRECKARHSLRALDVEEDALPPMTDSKSRKSTENETENVSFIGMKQFECKLQDAVKHEMDSLQKRLQSEYDAEFEKKKEEMIGAHQESLLLLNEEHEAMRKELSSLRKEYETKIGQNKVDLPRWAHILAVILAI